MRCLILLPFWLVLAMPVVVSAADLSILFLGDQGHHRPRERHAQLAPVLKARGIALTYTEELGDINPETLAKYQGLLLYANIDAIPPAAEQALLQYVEQGGGFMPLHCASYCFRNSDAVVALMGGQFQKHGGEEFGVEAAEPEHPILKGYGGFRSWDETYIHTKHNPLQRVVLEYRVQGGQAAGVQREPWTWVRTQGKGRVFYTAWGHDHRTWSNPGFHNLIERGIRWAVKGDPAAAGAYREPSTFVPIPLQAARTDVKPFDYVDVGAKIPNYLPSTKWGVQGEPLTLMQQPLAADESLKHYRIPEGFRIERFASDPEIGGKPLAMNWDERGRLWLCESYDYPNELQPAGEGRDRIRICEDTNGDGLADKFIVCAEKLSIPTAVLPCYGGALVQQGGLTQFLKDTNGDDQADVQETLVSNWNMGDTHGQVSNFQYGLDNWVWAMQGYNNSEPIVNGVKSPAFRMGFFRMRLEPQANGVPRVAELEFIRSTNNNTWGLGISEEGLIFGSTANHNPSVFMPIPNRYYERVRGWGVQQLGTIADSHLFKAVTDRVRQVDHHGGATAAAGHALYTARAYPPQYWNRSAFVCEPTGHLVQTFVLSRDGADFRSTSPANLAGSDDEWAAPIMAEVGPDGHVWLLDWYNFIVQHNPTPLGFANGKGNAYESDLRDKKHGRVYRLLYGAQPTAVATGWNASTPSAQLVEGLKHPNFWSRRQAQRLLIERQDLDVVPALTRLLEDSSSDELGLNPGVTHALWTLHGLGMIGRKSPQVMEKVELAAKHPAAGVRRNVVQVLPPDGTVTRVIRSAGLLKDADAQVRLAALLALSDDRPSSDSVRLLAEMFRDRRVVEDRWLRDALTSAMAMQGVAGLNMWLTWNDSLTVEQQDMLQIAAEHFARSRPNVEAVQSLLTELSRAQWSANGAAATVVAGVVKGWPKDAPLALSAEGDAALSTIFDAAPAASRGGLIRWGTLLGSRAFAGRIQEITASLAASLKDVRQPEVERIEAGRQLVLLSDMDPAVVTTLLEAIGPQTSTEMTTGLLEAIGMSRAEGAALLVIARLNTMTPGARLIANRVLLTKPQMLGVWLDAAEKGEVLLSDLRLDQKQALSNHPNRALRDRAVKLLKAGGGLPSADRAKVLAELMPAAQRRGDAMLGKEVFKKQCAKCHMHSGEGQKIGPDLTGMAVHPKSELLVHIVDPNRSVEGNYRTYTVVMNDGRVLSGMLAGESRTSIELIDVEGKRQAISREDIEELSGSAKSLMPEGFEKQVTPDEVAHLLEFLTQRGKYLPLPLGKVATVISTLGMFNDVENRGETMAFDDWSPKTSAGVPFQLIDPQGDRIPNVVLLHGENGKLPPQMPKAVEVPCNSPVKALHLLSGVSGWGFPYGKEGETVLLIRFHFDDGATETRALKNGEHFADYIRRVDVPGSRFAFDLHGKQIRYLSVTPERAGIVKSIEFLKGTDPSCPVIMSATVETQ